MSLKCLQHCNTAQHVIDLNRIVVAGIRCLTINILSCPKNVTIMIVCIRRLPPRPQTSGSRTAQHMNDRHVLNLSKKLKKNLYHTSSTRDSRDLTLSSITSEHLQRHTLTTRVSVRHNYEKDHHLAKMSEHRSQVSGLFFCPDTNYCFGSRAPNREALYIMKLSYSAQQHRALSLFNYVNGCQDRTVN